jgi:hypothetical protein
MMFKYLMASIFFLSLSACEKRNSPQYFLIHPEAIQPTYDRCITLNNITSERTKEECRALLSAIPVFRTYLLELFNNAGIFGLNLMHAQTKLVALKKYCAHLAQTSKDQKLIQAAKNAVDRQELQVKSRLAILRLVHQTKE